MGQPKHRPQRDLSNVSKIDWARLAAYIDGEGHISITVGTGVHQTKNGRKRLYLRVMVTNTDPRLIRWCKQTFGGMVGNYPDKNPKHRHTMKWGVSCRQAEKLLQGCLPYFICKRDQADIALAFQETFNGFHRWKELPPEVQLLRERLHQQLKDSRWVKHEISDLRVQPSQTDQVH